MKRIAKGIEYTLIQSVRSNIMLSVNAEGVVRLYTPKGYRLRQADAFVADHADEVARLKAKVQQQKALTERKASLTDGSRISVLGETVTLHIVPSERVSARLDGADLWIRTPSADHDTVRALIRQALSAEETVQVRRLISIYAPRLRVNPGRITIREQKSRWGSCSSKHNLNFNWKLMLAPPSMLQYVVIHELCHMIEFNHSDRFWTLVASQMPEYKTCVRWLKQNGAHLDL